MAQSFKRSDSLGYKLTLWNNSIQSKKDDYLKYLGNLYTFLDQEIVPIIIELQKYQGKITTHPVLNLKDNLFKSISSIEIQFIELIEYIIDFKVLVVEQNGLEFNFQTAKALVDLFALDLETLNSLKILIKDIAKGTNIVYKLSKKPPKKNEDQLELNYRSFIRSVKRLAKDYLTFTNGFRSLTNQLANEIEVKIKLEQERELQREKEQQK
ncbi:MAG: hypothetical protein FK734_13235 [Asgard group archaeon]|nr:hypothetical protein [Asgard group archaeon]